MLDGRCARKSWQLRQAQRLRHGPHALVVRQQQLMVFCALSGVTRGTPLGPPPASPVGEASTAEDIMLEAADSFTENEDASSMSEEPLVAGTHFTSEKPETRELHRFDAVRGTHVELSVLRSTFVWFEFDVLVRPHLPFFALFIINYAPIS